MIGMHAAGTGLVAASLRAGSIRAAVDAEKLTRYYGSLLRTAVRARASGRPGPNVVTGDYRRSITLSVERTATTCTAYVGTDKPQGRRLELGFVGVDALGRHYDQPPYPHFGPAADEVGPRYVDAVRRAALGWFPR